MIITAGKYKGKKVKTLKVGEVRPTSSKVRESIFNIVQLREESTIFYKGKTKFLDLFAGSGIMGLEALSRSADQVIFVEKNPESLKILKQNISIAQTTKNIKIIPGDSLRVLNRFGENEFNFIFADPPYEAGLYGPVLKKISDKKILADKGIIVLEHNREKDLSGFAKAYGFRVYKTKTYGDTGITILLSDFNGGY